MSDDRRYKQRGYKEYEDQAPRSSPVAQGAPRTRVITSYKETVRCDACGADLATLFDVREESVCPRCEASLHSCRNCLHFDPSARNECTEPIDKRIAKKSAANRCTFFMIRTIRVKDIGGSSPTKVQDARKALEDLFKK